jgi:hypothetical protein
LLFWPFFTPLPITSVIFLKSVVENPFLALYIQDLTDEEKSKLNEEIAVLERTIGF